MIASVSLVQEFKKKAGKPQRSSSEDKTSKAGLMIAFSCSRPYWKLIDIFHFQYYVAISPQFRVVNLPTRSPALSFAEALKFPRAFSLLWELISSV